MGIKFNIDIIKYISLFEKITRTKVKDCIESEQGLVFIVVQGQIGKAVGKQGANIRRLEGLFKKKVKIVEYSDDLIEFVRSYIMPLRADSIREEEDIIIMTSTDTKTKGLMIGKNAQNLRKLEEVSRRYFDVKEIKVVWLKTPQALKISLIDFQGIQNRKFRNLYKSHLNSQV